MSLRIADSSHDLVPTPYNAHYDNRPPGRALELSEVGVAHRLGDFHAEHTGPGAPESPPGGFSLSVADVSSVKPVNRGQARSIAGNRGAICH